MICSLTYNKLKDKMEINSARHIFRNTNRLGEWLGTNLRSFDFKIAAIFGLIGLVSVFAIKRVIRDAKVFMAQREADKLRSRLENDDSGLLKNLECIICMSNVRNVVHLPCGHVACCSTCYEAMPPNVKRRCPVCKTEITGVAYLHIG